jgi:hypothetical protein
MRYRLRTLLIVLAIGRMVLAGLWFATRPRPYYLHPEGYGGIGPAIEEVPEIKTSDGLVDPVTENRP